MLGGRIDHDGFSRFGDCSCCLPGSPNQSFRGSGQWRERRPERQQGSGFLERSSTCNRPRLFDRSACVHRRWLPLGRGIQHPIDRLQPQRLHNLWGWLIWAGPGVQQAWIFRAGQDTLAIVHACLTITTQTSFPIDPRIASRFDSWRSLAWLVHGTNPNPARVRNDVAVQYSHLRHDLVGREFEIQVNDNPHL